MDHFMLTPHEQLVETVLRMRQWTQGHVQSRIYGTLWITKSTWTTL